MDYYLTSLILGFSAFGGGVLTILSPCILPILPIYLTSFAGVSYPSVVAGDFSRWLLLKNSFLFVLGYSILFFVVVFGGVLSSSVASLLSQFESISGLLIISMGLLLIFKPQFTQRRWSLGVELNPHSSWYLFLLGLLLGVSWTPCVTPIIVSMNSLVSNYVGVLSLSYAAFIYGCYLVGLWIPFWVFGYFTQLAFKGLARFKGSLVYFEGVLGFVLVLVGVMVQLGVFSYGLGYLAS